MPIEYYFDQLEPAGFQRLIHALLVGRFGEAIRVMPLRGPDGGRDAETAPHSFLVDIVSQRALGYFTTDSTLGPGRYLFQVKHHRTIDKPGSVSRAAVLADFESELQKNVLPRTGPESVDYFFLITNVAASREVIYKLDEKRRELHESGLRLHADVLWQEHVNSWLDQSPSVWRAFPEIFAGRVIPLLAQVSDRESEGLSRTLRVALGTQFNRDGVVRFRQIDLERRLAPLFVDLHVRASGYFHNVPISIAEAQESEPTCLALLTADWIEHNKLILEGGPGQGKSTVTQMLAQLYRGMLLNQTHELSAYKAYVRRLRFPIRLELRLFSEWLSSSTDRSVEQYIAEAFSKDSGGADVKVDELHKLVEQTPFLLIFDGLDEVGSDELRDLVLLRIIECVRRFENDLKGDIRVILTSRPPAIARRANKLEGFRSAQIKPLDEAKIAEYLKRWTDVQCNDAFDRERIMNSFNRRRNEKHVGALAKNPMQLSVLLHFIRLKGEAFPDRRAELYREYFKTVIDRDVEKSPELRQNRDTIEGLHEVVGFAIHSRAESDTGSASLTRNDLMMLVQGWLKSEGLRKEAETLFRIGEERLGLIVALKGDGTDARYGFEIQPVREYFAAAFINDKCEGDAHEIFQAMIRRIFWREVALFLAGLRRANEKADLLSRSRALDDDRALGWRQDGLAIIFQLLQEGVLTTPGHVMREAVTFLLSSLDVTNSRLRYYPRRLIGILPTLVRECDGPEHQQILMRMLDDVKKCSDSSALWRLYSVANKVLPNEVVIRHLREFTSENKAIEARVKLVWPARHGVDPHCIIFESVDQIQVTPELIGGWYEVGLNGGPILDWPETAQYHNRLIEEFAFRPLDLEPILESYSPLLKPTPAFAVWALCGNVQRICASLLLRNDEACADGIVFSAGTVGLPPELAEGVQALVESSARAASELASSQLAGKSTREFLRTIQELLQADGLLGWVACRCAISIMRTTEDTHYQTLGTSRINYSRDLLREPLTRRKEWAQVRRLLPPFFRAGNPEDLDRRGRTLARRLVTRRFTRGVAPSHVRVQGQFISVPEMLREMIINGTPPVIPWAEHIAVPQYWLPSLLPDDRSELTLILEWLARHRVATGGPPNNLGLVKMLKISAALRSSNDLAVAAGALFALMGSKFQNVIQWQHLLRMLEADSHFANIGRELFRGPRDVLGRSENSNLARRLLESSTVVSQATGSAAAMLLLEDKHVGHEPLRELKCVKQTLEKLDGSQ